MIEALLSGFKVEENRIIILENCRDHLFSNNPAEFLATEIELFRMWMTEIDLFMEN